MTLSTQEGQIDDMLFVKDIMTGFNLRGSCGILSFDEVCTQEELDSNFPDSYKMKS